MAQSQGITQLQMEREQLIERVRKAKQDLARSTGISVPPLAARIVRACDGDGLSRDEREQLLSELGFNWHTTGDFVIVSKSSLPGITFNGMKGSAPTDVARAVLAITPEENAALETLAQRLTADYRSWAKSHIQREEPGGDVVAKYSLIADPTFSQGLTDAFVNGVLSALGQERGELLRDYAYHWMSEHGMKSVGVLETGTSLVVKRYRSGDEARLSFELRRGGGTMSADVSPRQPFPESFSPLFPNGWKDLAQREGFELPMEFQEK
jgi:hypothetical protein